MPDSRETKKVVFFTEFARNLERANLKAGNYYPFWRYLPMRLLQHPFASSAQDRATEPNHSKAKLNKEILTPLPDEFMLLFRPLVQKNIL
jgi:hypothetical protein